jgi:hypothetical protein
MELNLFYPLARESQHLPYLLREQLLWKKSPLVVAEVVLVASTLVSRVEMVLGTQIYGLLAQDALVSEGLQSGVA